MLTYMYHALGSFRSVFSQHRTWLLFVMVVLGCIVAPQIDGVSSFCRVWHLQTPGYLALLHFFRSSAWSLPGLLHCWGTFVLSQQQTVTVDGEDDAISRLLVRAGINPEVGLVPGVSA